MKRLVIVLLSLLVGGAVSARAQKPSLQPADLAGSWYGNVSVEQSPDTGSGWLVLRPDGWWWEVYSTHKKYVADTVKTPSGHIQRVDYVVDTVRGQRMTRALSSNAGRWRLMCDSLCTLWLGTPGWWGISGTSKAVAAKGDSTYSGWLLARQSWSNMELKQGKPDTVGAALLASLPPIPNYWEKITPLNVTYSTVALYNVTLAGSQLFLRQADTAAVRKANVIGKAKHLYALKEGTFQRQ